jgi:hypothetical protein
MVLGAERDKHAAVGYRESIAERDTESGRDPFALSACMR